MADRLLGEWIPDNGLTKRFAVIENQLMTLK